MLLGNRLMVIVLQKTGRRKTGDYERKGNDGISDFICLHFK